MTDLLAPYQLIDCSDILSCFQSIYNLLVILLIAFSFLLFVFGAFQYILSAANIFSTGEAKNRMKNSLTALIIGLVFSSLMYYINPNIFKVDLLIPKVKVELKFLPENNLTDDQIDQVSTYKYKGSPLPSVQEPSSPQDLIEWRLDRLKNDFSEAMSNVYIKGDDCHDSECQNGNKQKTEYANPQLYNHILNFAQRLKDENLYVMITDGYSPPSERDHKSKAHTHYGTAIDVVVVDKDGNKINPSDERWKKVMQIANSEPVGFGVLDERFKKGSEFSSGAHLHLYVKYNVYNTENFQQ